MKKNVGIIDRILRIIFGLFLIWLGFFQLKGQEGEVLGIFVALFSLVPFTIAATRVCPVFTIFKISSITKKEKQMKGG
jgi:uncharacterized membrane protein